MITNNYTHIPTSWESVLNIRTRLCEFISGHRLAHTLSVEKQAIDMAKIIFPVTEISDDYMSDVSCASLLHDITKHFSLDEHLNLCEKYSIPLLYKSDRTTALLHSKTGAHLSRELFCVNDTVFNAIYRHTVGCEDMDVISKIIFLADYIEPTREHDSCKKVRDMFYSSLNEDNSNALQVLDLCIVKSIDLTLKHLLEKHSPIHVQTVLTRNYLLSQSLFTDSKGIDYEKQ